MVQLERSVPVTVAVTANSIFHASLIIPGSKIISSERIAAAMKQIDRADFVLMKPRAYDDSPQPIGEPLVLERLYHSRIPSFLTGGGDGGD